MSESPAVGGRGWGAGVVADRQTDSMTGFICKFVEFHSFQQNTMKKICYEQEFEHAKSIAWTGFSLALDIFEEFSTVALQLYLRDVYHYVIDAQGYSQ